MTKFRTSALCLAALLMPAHALAAPVDESDTGMGAIESAIRAIGDRAAGGMSPRQRVCVINERANSRIRDIDCRTRAEWERAGGIDRAAD